MKQKLNQEATMGNDTTYDENGSTGNFVNRNLKEKSILNQEQSNWDQNRGNEIKGQAINNIDEEKGNEMLDINDGEYDDRRMYDDKEIDGNLLTEEGNEKTSRSRIRVETKL
jgi:hypothetical protein